MLKLLPNEIISIDIDVYKIYNCLKINKIIFIFLNSEKKKNYMVKIMGQFVNKLRLKFFYDKKIAVTQSL